MVALVFFMHNTNQRVLYALQLVKVAFHHSNEKGVAVVQTGSDDTAGGSPWQVIRKLPSHVESVCGKSRLCDPRHVNVERQALVNDDTETFDGAHQLD